MKTRFDTYAKTNQIVVSGGMDNFERRLPDYEGRFEKRAISHDISYWEIHKIDFPEGYSFKGWNMQRVKFVECSLPCDFTGADTHGMSLDMCTTKDAKGLDTSTLAENRMPNPFDIIATLPADALPRRRQSTPQPWGQKLT